MMTALVTFFLEYVARLRPKHIYAIANLIINPIALMDMFGNPSEEVFWLIVGWTAISSLANELARNIVYWIFKTLFTLGFKGVALFGVFGVFFVAIFFTTISVLVLAGVLVMLWLYALYLLRPD